METINEHWEKEASFNGGKEEVKEKEREEEEEDDKFLEGMAVLDFDMLCATVALQSQGLYSEKGRDLKGAGGGGVGLQRMWEGQVFDCFEDRRIAIETGCCPCSTFGKNMARAGFGSCFLQGGIHLLIVMIALVCFIAYAVTSQICFLYVAGAFTISVGLYLGYFRIQIRKRFNISGTDGAMEDCVNHLLCHCCTLCQESRTLEMNNVRDGVWHGRSDTICIGGSQREGSNKPFFELQNPKECSMERPGNKTDENHSWNEGSNHSEPLMAAQ
ncbi:hypothetical protein AMTRI_Chr02g260810 [Amborella trichopoda]|uniref:protein MID1-COMPLEMENTING ACTIVITY 2 n=1 Tax=Amborella trichopoda TaxID=13333 RepID=UPI0005D3566A|nr:protein MID1-COMPLEMENTING ACTIVITY 2 [Amborella trichopoda]|eukprot:XP_011620483.1 protein MID1-COMPLEMENTING ACTIVITY 2 [Amborella trichopoda]